jgi:putative SOS response-associated peptidase YedK
MCYSIAQVLKAREIEERFPARFINAEQYHPFAYVSAFNRPLVPVIASGDTGRIQLFRWGLVPSWVKDSSAADEISLKTLNARSETVFTKPAFSRPARERRCLVLASGFFESREAGGKKYPYHIWLKDSPGFAMAGIWDEWVDRATGELRQTFSILTTSANPLLEEIHNTRKRMPVILPRDMEMGWIAGGQAPSALGQFLKPYPAGLMQARTIARIPSRPGVVFLDQTSIRQTDYPELPPLKAISQPGQG